MKHGSNYPCGGMLSGRRDFLRKAGVFAGAGMLTQVPDLIAADDPNPNRPKAVVSVVENATVREAVRDAVAMSGGMDFIKPGQRVLIKTNATGGVKHPITTNPEVLFEVIKVVAEAGCTDIFVGDRSFFFISKVMPVLKEIGHYDAAMQAQKELGSGVKVTVVPFDEAGPYLTPGSEMWRTINHPLAKHFTENGGFQLAEILFQMDHVINLPCAKTHFQAWFTMAMKAFVGMSHADTRKYFHKYATTNSLNDQRTGGLSDIQPDVRPFTNRLVELNLGFAPTLNIIDATKPVVFGGPSDGDSTAAHTIIASRDRIAADLAGLALLRTLGTEKRIQTESPWKNPMIFQARKMGIGVKYKEDLTLLKKGLSRESDFDRYMA